MNKTDKLGVIVKNLATLTGELSRAQVREIASKAGFAPEDSHPLLKPTTRGTQRGHYSVSSMVALGESIINKTPKTKKVEVKKAAKVAVKKAARKAVAKKAVAKTIIDDEDNSTCLVVDGTYNFDAIAPTQDDIEDELSNMGTYM